MRDGIEALVFDCYGTLVDFDDDRFQAIFHEICAEQGLPVDGARLWDAWLKEGETLNRERGFDWRAVDGPLPEFVPYRVSWPRQFGRTFQRLGAEGDGQRAYALLYRRLVEGDLYPDVRPALDALQAGPLPLAVLSNADDDFLRDVLDRNGLDFGVVESSEAAGAYKPHRRIFEHIAERLGMEPAQILYVGDSAVSDVTGARHAGLRVAWVNRAGAALPPGTPEPDIVLASLEDLPALLDGRSAS